MPFEPVDALGGFTASPELARPREEEGSSTLGTVGKVAAPLAIGAGLFLAPEITIPALAAGAVGASIADPGATGAAFRTENTIGSLLSSEEMGVDDRRIDPQFDPWAEIQGTPYEPYYEQFGRAANREHSEAIKSDIDRENKDRDIIAKSGLVGMGATMAAGVLDLPSVLPGAMLVRSAKGGVSMLKTVGATAAAGTGAAIASEAVLQQSQQLRTAEESATVIAGSAVLSGLLGAGFGRRISRQEFDGLARRVEKDFIVPGPGEPDPFIPGSIKPSVEAAQGASEKARAVADAIRETAEEILPGRVRVQVVDTLGPVGDDGLFAIRGIAERELSEIFDEFNVKDIAELRQRAAELPDDIKSLNRLSDEIDRLDAQDIDRHYGADYEGNISGYPSSPESEAAQAAYNAILAKYRTDDASYITEFAKHELKPKLRKAEKFAERLARSGSPGGNDGQFSLRAKRYIAPEIETPNQIGDALKTIRETVEEAQSAPLKGRFAPDDLRHSLRAANMADVSFAGTTARARAIGEDGEEIGFVSGTVKGDVLIIDKTTLPETHQGKGYGVAMYRALIDAALDHGLRVESAYEVSEKASRVYDALARRGYKVERAPYRIEKKSGGRRIVVTDDLTRRPIAVTGKPEGSAPAGLYSLRAKRYTAPEIETTDQIGDALKTIRESVEEAQSAPLKGRFAPDDLRQRFIAYKKADTDLRAAMIGGLDPEDALARYAKLRGEAEGIVNDLRKTDARINRDIEKDMKAREGKGDLFSIRAFHGTAHDFDRFDLGKIGTGEGAQVFGHGLYFAENADVGLRYKQDLGGSDLYVDGKPFLVAGKLVDTTGNKTLDDALAMSDGDVGAAIHGADQMASVLEKSNPAAAKAQREIADALRDFTGEIETRPGGQLYEVEIDVEPHQLLDWDAPLSQQSPAVRASMERLGFNEEWRAKMRKLGVSDDPTGAQMYESSKVSPGDFHDKEVASKTLREAGIPGLRYLDQGSRQSKTLFDGKPIEEVASPAGLAAEKIDLHGSAERAIESLRSDVARGGYGAKMAQEALDLLQSGRVAVHEPDGTRNIVVFDDSLIKITKKNGEPVTAAERKAAVDQMFARRATPQGDIAEGHFDPQTLLITIAADALDPAKTLRHESIHALKTMGLFTGKEWGTLEAAAKKGGWLETNNIKALYEGVYKDRITDELLLEEAIAEQFSLWRQGAFQVKETIAKLFQRMKDFLERTGNALRGKGFQTADDVFAAVRSGEVGSRAPGGAPQAAGAIPAAGIGRGTSAGASAVQRADDTLKSALGLEKAFYWQDPMLRLQNSKSNASKRYVQELAETPLAYEKNDLGEPTAPGGSEMGAPGAVETRMKFWQGPLADSVQAVENEFLKYRKGHAKRFTGEAVMLNLKDTMFGANAMTWRGFKEEVSKSLRRGDEHPIPEVAAAARIARLRILDPLKDDAIATGQLPEGVTVETAASYLMRLYNKDLIIAERDQFKTIVGDWLQGMESAAQGKRTRISELVDRIDDAQSRIDRIEERVAQTPKTSKKIDRKKIKAQTDEAKAEIAELQKRIEKELGPAGKEAPRADDGEAPKLPKEKPALAVARKLLDEVDREPGEIQDLADQVIDRILGTPDGRLPYDAHLDQKTVGKMQVTVRGPLAPRDFMIPDAAIERYLENDIETVLRAYTRTMSSDVEITKRFGDVNMTLQMKEIAEDYARLSAQATTPEARRKLHRQRDNDIRDLAAIRDRLRGTYALPKNPDGIMVRSGRVINSLNYMRMLGGMTISAIPDTARTVMVHGLMNTAGDGLLPLLRNWSGARLAMTEVKLAGTALDMVLDSRAMQIADIMDDFGRHSKFERAIQTGARNFGVISLMAPWNAAMKQFAGLVTMTRMLRAMERIAAGKGRPKDVAMLASGGISEANARKIAAQFAKHGSKQGGVWHANTAAWDEGSRPAIEAFRAALVRDVDRIIVTPGQERPLWMSTETGRLIGQFKSFSISAMQRVLISGLQQKDMATLNGAIMMVALGGLATVLRSKLAGQPVPDLSDRQKQAQFLVESIDRSGLTGWMMEANSMTEKLTRGAVGLSAITGKPVSRYASRNIASALMGPTAGTIQDFTRVVGAAAAGEWNQSDTKVMRRLIPYNNIFYLRQLFDNAEAGINGFFGVPKPAGAKR